MKTFALRVSSCSSCVAERRSSSTYRIAHGAFVQQIVDRHDASPEVQLPDAGIAKLLKGLVVDCDDWCWGRVVCDREFEKNARNLLIPR